MGRLVPASAPARGLVPCATRMPIPDLAERDRYVIVSLRATRFVRSMPVLLPPDGPGARGAGRAVRTPPAAVVHHVDFSPHTSSHLVWTEAHAKHAQSSFTMVAVAVPSLIVAPTAFESFTVKV